MATRFDPNDPQAPVDFVRLWPAAEARFTLGTNSIHGPAHWRRVEQNAVMLADESGADVTIVRAFAALHDCCRWVEYHDPEHGLRAARFAATLRGTILRIDDAAFALLEAALVAHDRGETSTDPTVGCCWDADRLDLWRVGMTPHANFMSTSGGRKRARG